MILRNPTDKEESKTRGTAVEYLFNGVDGMPGAKEAPKAVAAKRAAPKPPPPPAAAKAEPVKPPPPPIIVEVIHGSRRADAKFEPETNTKASEAKQ